jgi:abhydrolase domain-containing protein 17
MRRMPEIAYSIARMVLFLAAGYALLTLLLPSISERMLFPKPPTKYELTADYVQLTAPDGVKLAARYWPNPGAKYTLLYLHGNYEDLGSIGEYMPSFLKAGYAVFALDYRHYGHSEGQPTEANTIADVTMAYEYLRTRLGVPPERIVVFGYSLGGGPGVELALHQPMAGLVVQGAFVSVYRVLSRVPLFPGDKFCNLDKMPRLKVPVLVIHGTDDRTVPFWHGAALYEATTSRKMKLFIEGGRHGGLADTAGPRYWEVLKAFTDSL